MSFVMSRRAHPATRAKARAKAEAKRAKAQLPHRVEYFHQHDDPYSHLAQQTLAALADRYDIELVTYRIRGTGGAFQPELEQLAAWATRDAEMIAPHYGLTPPSQMNERDDQPADAATLDAGSARLAELGHYSGAMFYYGGEWYWGVDRLFYLEKRLRDLGACKDASLPFIAPRPDIDVSGVDARALTLDFYPSLNSPYTSIIFDKTIDMARECGIQLNHKPVLPMLMRGLPVPRKKGAYIVFDTAREAEHLGVPFGNLVFPVGEPTRSIYTLLPWARRQGKDIALLSAALRLAFAEGVGLHTTNGLRMAVEHAELSWNEARVHLDDEAWLEETAAHQREMTQALGLWGVPSFRLRSEGEEDLCVWGQDRLWLIAAEIRRRASAAQTKGAGQAARALP
ncbi:MAG: DsbA family protein [Erythrobacter sp.]|nr:DsbA family protein [Erythrobacter sp.]